MRCPKNKRIWKIKRTKQKMQNDLKESKIIKERKQKTNNEKII